VILSGPPVSASAMGLTVYDNGTDQPIGGGNLVIHQAIAHTTQEARPGLPSLASCLFWALVASASSSA